MFYDKIKEFCREWGEFISVGWCLFVFFLFIFAFVKTTSFVADSAREYEDRQWQLEQLRNEKYNEIAALIEQGNYDCREIYKYNLTQEQQDSLANKCLIYQNS